MMRSTEIAALRQLILDSADERGLEVDKIFEDELDMSTDQLSECLGVLMCVDEPIMIVPDLSHFAGNGNPFHVKHAFEQEGIQVLSARRRPPPHIDIDPLKEV